MDDHSFRPGAYLADVFDHHSTITSNEYHRNR